MLLYVVVVGGGVGGGGSKSESQYVHLWTIFKINGSLFAMLNRSFAIEGETCKVLFIFTYLRLLTLQNQSDSCCPPTGNGLQRTNEVGSPDRAT